MKNIYLTEQYQCTYSTNFTHEIIVPERTNLGWSRKSTRLQMGEIQSSMVTNKKTIRATDSQLHITCNVFTQISHAVTYQ